MTTLTPIGPQAERPRVALYGHDTLGLGHLRRNLALAGTFAADADTADGPERDLLGADVLMLSGATELGLFERPEGVDALVVPGVRKDDEGGYSPRQLRSHLATVIELRRSMLTNALLTFAPDLLVVDKAPWGFGGELADVLPRLRRAGTKLVLGLRDVLDDADIATAQWHSEGGEEAVREVYDEVWVYGDSSVHDVTAACSMSAAVAAKCHHVGYLSEGRPSSDPDHRPLGDRPYVLVTSGGGQDGAELIRAAVSMAPRPDHDVLVLTGPQMKPEVISELRAAAEDRADMHVMRFSRHGAAWQAGARAVISMGGANTVAEQLATDVPVLIVPRVTPRLEQLVRAEALADRGLVDMLHPVDLCGQALSTWVDENAGRRVGRRGLALDGLAEVRRRAAALIAAPGTHQRQGTTGGRALRAVGGWRDADDLESDRDTFGPTDHLTAAAYVPPSPYIAAAPTPVEGVPLSFMALRAARAAVTPPHATATATATATAPCHPATPARPVRAHRSRSLSHAAV